MPWKVKHTAWLAKEADRVQAIILLPKFWGKVWTEDNLKEELDNVGLEYSAVQITAIRAELVSRKDLEAE